MEHTQYRKLFSNRTGRGEKIQIRKARKTERGNNFCKKKNVEGLTPSFLIATGKVLMQQVHQMHQISLLIQKKENSEVFDHYRRRILCMF